MIGTDYLLVVTSMEDQKVMYMDRGKEVLDANMRKGGKFETIRNCKHTELDHYKGNEYKCRKCSKVFKCWPPGKE